MDIQPGEMVALLTFDLEKIQASDVDWRVWRHQDRTALDWVSQALASKETLASQWALEDWLIQQQVPATPGLTRLVDGLFYAVAYDEGSDAVALRHLERCLRRGLSATAPDAQGLDAWDIWESQVFALSDDFLPQELHALTQGIAQLLLTHGVAIERAQIFLNDYEGSDGADLLRPVVTALQRTALLQARPASLTNRSRIRP